MSGFLDFTPREYERKMSAKGENMKLRHQVIGTAAAGAVLCLPFAANAAAEIYGKIHLSADYMDTGATEGHALSSNASRLGLKGKEQITDSVKAFFKIEFETTFEESTIDGKDTIFTSLNI